MTHGSLFSGIGGFDLAAEWMGWENKFHCEWNPFCQRVLKYYWPDAKSYGDIDNTDFTIWRGLIDVLSGGFPCQPYSTAGKRKGKEDDRHKWPQMLRAIREIQPGYVVGENVRGLTNWNGGLVFDEVQADLEAEGYEVLPFLLPACGVEAPHQRDRIWFIANRCSFIGSLPVQQRRQEKTENINADWVFETSVAPNNSSQRLQISTRREQRKVQSQVVTLTGGKSDRTSSKAAQWERFPAQPAFCGRDDGISRKLDGITFSSWRKKSIEGYGNAIVPQLAYQIFKAIEQVNNNSI